MAKTAILKDICPHCGCALFIKAIDEVSCTNRNCQYGELHLIGEGTLELKSQVMMLVNNYNPKEIASC